MANVRTTQTATEVIETTARTYTLRASQVATEIVGTTARSYNFRTTQVAVEVITTRYTTYYDTLTMNGTANMSIAGSRTGGFTGWGIPL